MEKPAAAGAGACDSLSQRSTSSASGFSIAERKYHCTHDKKERLATLTGLYVDMLCTGKYDAAVINEALKTNFQSGEALDRQAAFPHAIALAQGAFRPDPQFYLPPQYAFPSHCFHLEVMEIESLKDALQQSQGGEVGPLDDYLKKVFSSSENCLYAMTSRLPASGNSPMEQPDLEALLVIFRTIDRANSNFSKIIESALQQIFTEWRSVDSSKWAKPVAMFCGTKSTTYGALLSHFVSIMIVGAVALNMQTMKKFILVLNIVLAKNESYFVDLFSKVSPAFMREIVGTYQNCLSLELQSEGHDDQLNGSASMLQILFKANYVVSESGIVPHTTFYNGYAADFENMHVRKDYERFLKSQHEGLGLFSFVRYPFLVDANFKSWVMQLEALVEQNDSMRSAILTMMFQRNMRGPEEFFFVLKVDRHKLIESSLNGLARASTAGGKAALAKPLKVHFDGEEGVDEGGVRKEFFQLICKEILDPNYNMFCEKEPSRALWFQPVVRCPDCKPQFYLIGQIIGLAVHNNVILDVAFSSVVYRKLLGLKLNFDDFKELDPAFAQSLEMLLQFDESQGMTVEDVFCRNFTVEYEVFGESVEAELLPGGKNMPLTAANRKQFVDLMVDHVLVTSVKANFEEFRRGFFSVCNRSMMNHIRPEELELLVCGNPNLDFVELENNTRYEGFTPGDVTIRLFWDVIHNALTTEQKKQFLKFCTGSDRVPIRGLKDLGFVIGKNGDDSDLLPTSHTCFNHLLLPAYLSVDKLKAKLLQAIQNCTGFGLRQRRSTLQPFALSFSLDHLTLLDDVMHQHQNGW